MRDVILLLAITLSISADLCRAQENECIDHVVYLIGNTATREINESHLASLQEGLSEKISSDNIMIGVDHGAEFKTGSYRIDKLQSGCPHHRTNLIRVCLKKVSPQPELPDPCIEV